MDAVFERTYKNIMNTRKTATEALRFQEFVSDEAPASLQDVIRLLRDVAQLSFTFNREVLTALLESVILKRFDEWSEGYDARKTALAAWDAEQREVSRRNEIKHTKALEEKINLLFDVKWTYPIYDMPEAGNGK